MRITNSMMSNRMMLNINRNMRLLDNLQMQWSTGKRIQFPSENPIIASRALNFRTAVAQNQQHQRNVDQAESWMEMTESGFTEVTRVLTRINELVVSGDAIENVEGMQAIATQIASYLEQLGLAMNASYTGRYLFSGFRTDQPGVILRDDPTLRFEDITQRFTSRNVEDIHAIQRFEQGAEPVITEASVLKLPYTGAENVRVTIGGFTAAQAGAMPGYQGSFTNATIGAAVAGGAPGDIFFNTDTGEVTIIAPDKMAHGSTADVDAFKPGEFEIFHVVDTGQIVLGSAFASAQTFDVQYDKEGFQKGDLNPIVYFTVTDPSFTPPRTFSMEGQHIEYEFGIGTRFPINSLAKDVVSAHMIADIRSFVETVLGAEISERSDIIARLGAMPENAGRSQAELSQMADAQIAREEQMLMTALQSKFSNMIQLVQNHNSSVSRHQTDLGARMSRLDLVRERLERDEISLERILSQNEDADLVEVAMRLSNAEAVYQASLMAGINMVQLSLANFL